MAIINAVGNGLTGASGSGSFAGTTSPVFVTPTLGVATATTLNKYTITAPATGSTLVIADGKTLTVSNTVTFTGTDASSIAFGAGGTLAYTTTYTAWTPVFTFTTPGDLSVSYATQVGGYVKVGNIYVVSFNLVCTPTFTTSSGDLTITGLPVASNSTTGNIAVGSVYTSAMVWPATYTALSLQINAGASVIGLVASKAASSATNFASTNFTTGVACTIVGTICYMV